MIVFKEFTDSSTVQRIEYNQNLHKMYVTFITGKKYEYIDIPVETWDHAIKATSIGSFINNSIKGKYQFKQIQD